MRRMVTFQDLIEEAKIRFLWWAICIFAITYFLSHTSKSMWMNIPIAALIALLLRVLANEVEFHWKISSTRKKKSCSEKKQLPVTDSCLSSSPSPPKWKGNFDSPVVEDAVEDFVDKIVQDFITDLWYSSITPDKEAPELMHTIVLDALGEVAVRVKEVNLVDLLTRDLVDLIGDHLELYRRTQATIGVDVMVTLSSEERDEKLKHHLMASNELHPALVSSESEHKVLQQLVAGLLGIVLKSSEAQCSLVRCIAREFVARLVIHPIMDLVNPQYINELMEFVLLRVEDLLTGLKSDGRTSKTDHDHPFAEVNIESGESTFGRQKSSSNQKTDMPLATKDDHREMALEHSKESSWSTSIGDSAQSKIADWARKLDAATLRRVEVLAPENLENMWTIGRHYKEKINKVSKEHGSLEGDNKLISEIMPGSHIVQGKDGSNDKTKTLNGTSTGSSSKEVDFLMSDGNQIQHRRSSSTSDLKIEPEENISNTGGSEGLLISEESYSPDLRSCSVQHTYNVLGSGVHSDGSRLPKLRCRVVGAYYDKTASKSFAVHSIAVTDAQNSLWFVKRRYRNFEQLHRHLKEIPNYNLQLPPKRIFSSSTEDAFVHRRCIKLDKYLQNLLSIPNVAEQHDVWDFLSASSKLYSSGKSSSEMQTLAVNVEEAIDDIVRQFKGVPDVVLRKAVGSSSCYDEALPSMQPTNISLNGNDFKMHNVSVSSMGTAINVSDNEEGDKGEIHDHNTVDSNGEENGWHSDNELNSKSFPPRVVKLDEDTAKSYSGRNQVLKTKSNMSGLSHLIDDQVEVPPEWAPPNVTVPVLNLVDKVFQLNKRGWIRRQVFWISRQILQVVMEDAVDDLLLRQINLLRKEEVIAQGIRWVKDKLWPDGKFFLKLQITGGGFDEMGSKCFQATSRAAGTKSSQAGSFERQLEAARRVSYIRNFLLYGAPAPLVGFVGQKQYKRCARDIFFFLQSSICLKQVGYAVLELVLVSIFPELKDIVADINPNTRTKSFIPPSPV